MTRPDLAAAPVWWPPIVGVADVPRWIRFLYCLSRLTGDERRRAGAVVLWTVDTILREPRGVAALDAILAGCDAGRLSSGAVVSLARGTYCARERLPSRASFLGRAVVRLRALGRDSLVASNDELALVARGRDLAEALDAEVSGAVRCGAEEDAAAMWQALQGGAPAGPQWRGG